MKVILLKDVKGIGRKHETMEIADGHALNYLIPKKLAIPATPSAMKEAELRRKQVTDRTALDTALLAQNIATLAEARIVIKAKANEKGHLFASIHKEKIVSKIYEEARLRIPGEYVHLERPIKEIGEHVISFTLGNKMGTFKLMVENKE